MRLPSTPLNKIKNIVHVAQAGLIILEIILCISAFASTGTGGGRLGWALGLSFLSIPALIYLTMVPAWSRARKFSNIYAFASLDCFMVIAWLSGWAAVTDYVVSGKGKGDNQNASGCANFKFGSASRCRLSEAVIIFGVFTMLLFVATALISFKAVWDYKRTGLLPHESVGGTTAGPFGDANAVGGSKTGTGVGTGSGSAPPHDDEAFDSNMNLRDNWEVEEYDHDEYHDRYGGDARQGGAGIGAGSGVGTHGYGRVGADEHDDYDERQHLARPSGGQTIHNNEAAYAPYETHPQPRPHSGAGAYADDHELSGHRPASAGPGPLGNDTSYQSPGYAQYGR